MLIIFELCPSVFRLIWLLQLKKSKWLVDLGFQLWFRGDINDRVRPPVENEKFKNSFLKFAVENDDVHYLVDVTLLMPKLMISNIFDRISWIIA